MKRIKSALDILKKTPFHPQWFAFKNNNKNLDEISKLIKGKVLDIGCGKQAVKKLISKDFNYIGLDYFATATEWYESYPDIYGNAQHLPFANESFSSILLLDVLEHLPNPDDCLCEVNRVLEKNGSVIITVPFLYPIHDAPLDYNRWTLYGLKKLLSKNGFNIINIKYNGNLYETAGLLLNIAMSKMQLNWVSRKSPAALTIFLLPFAILAVNLIFQLLNYISIKDQMMPFGYRLVAEKLNELP